MSKHELNGLELLAVMSQTVGHRRVMGLMGAVAICGLAGLEPEDWEGMYECLRGFGFSKAAVYNIRADFRRCAEKVRELEGGTGETMTLVRRVAELRESGLTPTGLVC